MHASVVIIIIVIVVISIVVNTAIISYFLILLQVKATGVQGWPTLASAVGNAYLQDIAASQVWLPLQA